MPLTRAELDAANAGNLASARYFQQLFELRRRHPGDDLTTQLVHSEEQGNKLTNEELTANVILLFGAGHETTVNLIGNGLMALYRNPDQLRLLREDPSLITNAIEEFLRYDFSVQVTGRTALEDLEVGETPSPKAKRFYACSALPIATQRSIRIPIFSTLRERVSVHCRSGVAFTFV